MLPWVETEAQSGAGRLSAGAGSRKGQQVFGLPTGLSGYQAAFVLSGLLLTGIKPLGFSLQEIERAFPNTAPS